MPVDISSLPGLLTLLASLLAFFYLYARYKLTYWRRRGVPSPPAHWLFGHFRDAILLRSGPPQVLGDLHKSNPREALLGVYILHKPFLLIRSSELLKQILVKDFNVFPDRYFASKRKTDVVGSAGLFSVDNPEWKYLRAKLSPGFTSGKQKNLFGLMLESAENMRTHLAGRVSKEGQISLEVTRISTKYTTDVISSLSFGIGTNSFDEPEPEFYVRSELRRGLPYMSYGRAELDYVCGFFFTLSLSRLFTLSVNGNDRRGFVPIRTARFFFFYQSRRASTSQRREYTRKQIKKVPRS